MPVGAIESREIAADNNSPVRLQGHRVDDIIGPAVGGARNVGSW